MLLPSKKRLHTSKQSEATSLSIIRRSGVVLTGSPNMFIRIKMEFQGSLLLSVAEK